MDITQYKQKIDAGKPINFQRFLELLAPSPANDWHRYYTAKKISANQYQVTVLDHSFHQALEKPKPKDRIEATKQGDSHASNLSVAHILVWTNTKQSTPEVVVVFEKGAQHLSFRVKKKLLLIENQECFFRLEEMLNGLNHFVENQINIGDYDVALGNGDAVTNQLLQPYLKQYKTIDCAFDFDLAGLQMYRSLKRSENLNSTTVNWLAPSELAPYYKDFLLKAKTSKRLLSAIELAYELNLPHVAEAFRTTQQFMEQEMLLIQR